MKKNVFMLKDDNGKQIETSISDIADFNGDCDSSTGSSFGISDSARKILPTSRIPNLQVTFSDGRVADPLSVIADMKSGKLNVVAVDIEAEATHDGLNLNDCMYYEDSMEKDAETFMNPFQKPVLKNHDSYSGEPLGRTKAFRVGQSNIAPEKTAIFLNARITDKDAMEKFLDGRYGTVSIGGSMGTVTCNLCGKTILKDGVFKFCGHWRGESYNGKKCSWGARDITYHEWSVVNNPADEYAIITKANVVLGDQKSSEDSKNKQEDSNKMGNTSANDSLEKKKHEFLDFIDELLAKANPAPVADQNNGGEGEPATDPKNPEGVKDATGNEGDPTPTPAVQDNEDHVSKEDHEKVKQELADSQEKIKTLEQQITDSKEEKEKLDKKVKEAEDAKKVLEDDLKAARDNLSSTALFSKTMVIDFIIASENLAEDSAEARKTELLAKSMKELADFKDSFKKVTRPLADVKSPALSGQEPDVKDVGNNSDSNKNADKKDNKANPIQSIINSFGKM